MFNLTSKSSFHTQRILIFMIQYVVKWSQINSKEKLSKFQNLCQILLTLCQSMSIQQSIICRSTPSMWTSLMLGSVLNPIPYNPYKQKSIQALIARQDMCRIIIKIIIEAKFNNLTFTVIK